MLYKTENCVRHTLATMTIDIAANIFGNPTALLTMQFRMLEIRSYRFHHFVDIVNEPHPAGLSNWFEVRPEMIDVFDEELIRLTWLWIVIKIYYWTIKDRRVNRDGRR